MIALRGETLRRDGRFHPWPTLRGGWQETGRSGWAHPRAASTCQPWRGVGRSGGLQIAASREPAVGPWPGQGAGVASGTYADVEEASSVVELREEVTEPNPERVKIYGEHYEVYRTLYPATRSAMSRLTDLAAGSAG